LAKSRWSKSIHAPSRVAKLGHGEDIENDVSRNTRFCKWVAGLNVL
jgi:hypothetical protein